MTGNNTNFGYNENDYTGSERHPAPHTAQQWAGLVTGTTVFVTVTMNVNGALPGWLALLLTVIVMIAALSIAESVQNKRS